MYYDLNKVTKCRRKKFRRERKHKGKNGFLKNLEKAYRFQSEQLEDNYYDQNLILLGYTKQIMRKLFNIEVDQIEVEEESSCKAI